MILWSDKPGVLGNFITRKSTKDKMVITIDGQIFTHNITAAKYPNAMDVGSVVNEQFVGHLKTGRNALVKTFDAQSIEFPLEGAGTAIEEARQTIQ